MLAPGAPRVVGREPAAASGGIRLRPGEPDTVLKSTDFYPLARFAAAPLRFPARFYVELGDAEMTLQLRDAGDQAEVVRTIIGTGAAPAVKTYRVPRPTGEAREIVAPGLRVVGVSDGVLVYEADSGNYGVTSDLWFYYGLGDPRGGDDGQR